MRSIVLCIAAGGLGLTSAHRSSRTVPTPSINNNRPSRFIITNHKSLWNLPRHHHHHLIHEHELSVAAFVSSLIPRGGQRRYDYYDERGFPNYNDDDPYSQQQPQQYNDDYHADDDAYDTGHGDYDDRGSSRSPLERRNGNSNEGGKFKVPEIIKTGNRKIGLPLLGIGAALTLLGVSLFFNKTLMRLGNLFFVAGVPMTIGPGRTAGYFFQPKKARATGCLVLGIFLVFVGHPVLGIILEIFGLLNLFGNMFPVAMAILKTMPVIGPILKGAEGSRDANNNSANRDPYYDDRYDRDPYYDDRSYYDDGGDQDDQSYKSRYY